jgi:cytochrome bd-type quinol oxidase subunit 2
MIRCEFCCGRLCDKFNTMPTCKIDRSDGSYLPRAERQREAIAKAIGPIWEANHVWLILVVVLLFTGFPAGFAAMMTALNIPLTAMLIGIVLRGSAFIFRKYDSRSDATQRRWSMLFGVASFCTPFFQGIILGPGHRSDSHCKWSGD